MAVTITLLNHIMPDGASQCGMVRVEYVAASGTGTLLLPNIGGSINKVVANKTGGAAIPDITLIDADSVDLFYSTLLSKSVDIVVYPTVAGSAANNTDVKSSITGRCTLTLNLPVSPMLPYYGNITIYYG